MSTLVRRTVRRTTQEPVEPTQVTAIRRRRVPPVAVQEEAPAAPTPDASSAMGRVDYDGIIATYKSKATTPKNAIRAHCMECMGGMMAEVNRCSSTSCALFPFRLGKNPFHKLAKGNQAPEVPDEE